MPHPPRATTVPVFDDTDFTHAAGLHADALEAKRATHDGRVWPVARARMQSPRCIRQRMAEDIAERVRRSGEDAQVDHGDMFRLGWNGQQVRDHGPAALRLFHERREMERRAAEAAARAARPLKAHAEDAAALAALVTFCGTVLLTARLMAGA